MLKVTEITHHNELLWKYKFNPKWGTTIQLYMSLCIYMYICFLTNLIKNEEQVEISYIVHSVVVIKIIYMFLIKVNICLQYISVVHIKISFHDKWKLKFTHKRYLWCIFSSFSKNLNNQNVLQLVNLWWYLINWSTT
jgi:hypothetical protein